MSDQATRAQQALNKSKRRSMSTIPDPNKDINSIHATLMGIKELLEVLAGQRGRALNAAVTWQDLLDLQMINQADIPTDIGTR